MKLSAFVSARRDPVARRWIEGVRAELRSEEALDEAENPRQPPALSRGADPRDGGEHHAAGRRPGAGGSARRAATGAPARGRGRGARIWPALPRHRRRGGGHAGRPLPARGVRAPGHLPFARRFGGGARVHRPARPGVAPAVVGALRLSRSRDPQPVADGAPLHAADAFRRAARARDAGAGTQPRQARRVHRPCAGGRAHARHRRGSLAAARDGGAVRAGGEVGRRRAS